MDCEQARAFISAQIDGEIAPEGRIALEAHLAECAACRDSSTALRLLDADLRRAFSPRRQSVAAIVDRVIAELPAARRPARLRLSWLPLVVAAAAGFLIAVVLFRPGQQRPAPGDAGRIEDLTGVATDNRSFGTESPASIAQLAYASGPIEMQRPGDHGWIRMQTGAAIPLGARVRTGPFARCELRTLEGSLVRLNTQTELLFRTNRKLELAGGEIWNQVEESNVSFEVGLPREAAKVTALGTQFDVHSAAAETLVTVARGRTRVDGKGWQEVVNHGQQVKIVGGSLSSTRRVPNLAVATSWVHEILKMKGDDNPELAERMNDLLAQIGEGKVTYMPEKEILDLGTHCVLPLTRFIESDRSAADPFKRINAARILAKIAQPWSVPDLVALLADRDGEVRYYAATALQRLTGVTQGFTAEQWRDSPPSTRETALKKWQSWWEENRARYPVSPFPSKSRDVDGKVGPDGSARPTDKNR